MTTMLFLHMSGIFLTSFMLQASRMASRERGEDEVVRVEELPGLCYSWTPHISYFVLSPGFEGIVFFRYGKGLRGHSNGLRGSIKSPVN